MGSRSRSWPEQLTGPSTSRWRCRALPQADRFGVLGPGMLADLAVLTDDYFVVQEDEIPDLRSLLTIVGGRIVHAEGSFDGLRG